ncbi:MAG TPA: phosphatase PAP2 family protein, partial [Gaiellales bacterium]|nr:phosphatase PAP2 family protein [Gaiellales bacterium]
MRANTRDEEVAVLPVAALLAISIVAGLSAWAIARPVLRRTAGRQPTRAVADELRDHTAVRRFVGSRLDTEVLTGLALTLAVCMLCVAGVVISLLVVLIHHSEPLSDLDAGAARWAHQNTGEATRRFLNAVTTLASTRGVIVIAVVVGVVEWIRVPNRWIPVFLLAVTLGDVFVTTTIKGIVDRSRPTIDPLAAHLGPSFPSGHSSTAAALFAALALLA